MSKDRKDRNRILVDAARSGVGLHLKLALAGSVSVFLCVALLSAILVYRQSAVLNGEIDRASNQLQHGMIERGRLLAQSMGTSMETAIAGYDFAFITQTVKTMQANNENLRYAFLTNAAGVIIVHTDPHRIGGRAPSAGVSTAPRYLATADGLDVVEITHPLVVGGRDWGWLALGFDLTPIRSEAAAARRRGQGVLAEATTLALFVATLVALLGLGASVWTSRRLLRPVVGLAEDAAAIAEGNLDQEIAAIDSADEIGVLARQFEAMRRSVRNYISELVVAKQTAEEATQQEKGLRAEIEEHSRLLEDKVRERTAELVESNDQLTEYDRLKSEFLSNVSHELRTPLAAISSAAKIIKRYGSGDTKANERFSGVIIEETQRLTRLINDLLDLSKIEAGKTEWSLELLPDPRALLEHVVTTFRPLYQESDIELTLRSEPDLPALRTDRDRMIQVLTNLCSNARKFTPRGGHVEISACRSTLLGAPALRIAVSDSGCGIPETEREAVFERFRQGGGADKPAGTGLGLTICREVVNYHGGTICAEAPPEGGTRMVILLPAARESTEIAPPRTEPGLWPES
ncbi:MAG: signal transduction histidine kinase [Hyphomicrobiaceae bacterium]|jgi:signal transduction histidine kinase